MRLLSAAAPVTDPGCVMRKLPVPGLRHAAAPALRYGLRLPLVVAPALPEEPEERLAERRPVEVGDDVAVEAEADAATLLAEDDDDGVGLLGDAERRAVTRPERLVEDLRVGHREEDARLRDAEVPDDDGAVVELVQALREKQADEELPLHRRVDRRPLPHHELVQVRVLLEGDEGAHAVARELRRRRHDLVDRLGLLLPREPSEDRPRADAHEPAADVVLEDHDDDEDDRRRRQQRVEEVVEGEEARPLREDVDEKDDAEPHAHLHGPRSAQDEERAVDEERHHQDVAEVRQHRGHGATREQMKEALEKLEHRAIPPRGAAPNRWLGASRGRRGRGGCERPPARHGGPPRSTRPRAHPAGLPGRPA